MNKDDNIEWVDTFLRTLTEEDYADDPGEIGDSKAHYWQRGRCWIARYRREIDMAGFYNWKCFPDGSNWAARIAHDLVELIRAWQPVIPMDWIITTPPQGASLFKSEDGVYPAGVIGKLVSCELGIDYVTMFRRDEVKRWHSPYQTARSVPFSLMIRPSSVVLIVDDMISSGNTMQNCTRCCEEHKISCFGFAWVGR